MKKSIIIIGIFTTIVTTLFSIFIIRASNLMGNNSYTIYTEMDNVNGIVTDASVKIAGINVGKVKSLVLKKNNRVLLTLEINGDVRLPSDSVIQIKPLGILGSSFLKIKPGTNSNYIASNQELQSINKAGLMENLTNSAGNIGKEVEGIAGTVNTYLSQSKILETISSISKELNAALLHINALLETVQTATEKNTDFVNTIISTTAQITDALAHLIVEDKSSDANLSQTLLAIRNSLVNIEEITGKVNTGTGSMGKLINEQELYDNVTDATKKLNTNLDDINTIISPITQLKTAINYRFEALLNEELRYTPKQHVNVQVEAPDSYQYYQIGISHGGGEFLVATDTPYPTLPIANIKLNLTIGLGLYKEYFVLHGGLIENTLGFRLNIKPLKEWILTSEVYNFGSKNGVNIRTLTYLKPFVFLENTDNPLKWLYINGGADDILGNYTRTYFVGLGLHITDK